MKLLKNSVNFVLALSMVLGSAVSVSAANYGDSANSKYEFENAEMVSAPENEATYGKVMQVGTGTTAVWNFINDMGTAVSYTDDVYVSADVYGDMTMTVAGASVSATGNTWKNVGVLVSFSRMTYKSYIDGILSTSGTITDTSVSSASFTANGSAAYVDNTKVEIWHTNYGTIDFTNSAKWSKLVDDNFDAYTDGTKLDGIVATEDSGATYGSKDVWQGNDPTSKISIASDSERGKVLSVGVNSTTAAGLTFGEALTAGVVAVSMDVKISNSTATLKITAREGAPNGTYLNGTGSTYSGKTSDGKNPDHGDIISIITVSANGIKDSTNNVEYKNSIETDKWINLKFVYDIDATKYDIYADGRLVNDEPIAFSEAWINNSNQIHHKYKFFSSLYFTSNNASTSSVPLIDNLQVYKQDLSEFNFADSAKWSKLVDDNFDAYTDGTKLDGIVATEDSGATYGSKDVWQGNDPTSKISIASDSERGKVLSVGVNSTTAAGLTFGEALTAGVVAVSMDVKISNSTATLKITAREGAPNGTYLNGTGSTYSGKTSDGKNPDHGDIISIITVSANGIKDSTNNVEYKNSIETDKWINLKFVYDIDATKYDIYADGRLVNDEPIAFSEAWINNSNQIHHKYKFFSSLYFTSNNASTSSVPLIDNLQVYKQISSTSKTIDKGMTRLVLENTIDEMDVTAVAANGWSVKGIYYRQDERETLETKPLKDMNTYYVESIEINMPETVGTEEIIVAVYDANGRFVNAAIKQISDITDGVLDVSADKLEAVYDGKTKVFVWNMGTLAPVMQEAYNLDYQTPRAGVEPSDKTRIYVASDSLSAPYSAATSSVLTGWGELLGQYFNQQDVEVMNYGRGGRSAKSFYNEEACWFGEDSITENIKEGDWLLVSFAHNDAKNIEGYYSKPWSQDTTDTQNYVYYLNKYYEFCTENDIQMVIVTPTVTASSTSCNAYAPDGTLPYVKAGREFAKNHNIPIIDNCETMKQEHIAKVAAGETYLEYYMCSIDGTDRTHTTNAGAQKIAKAIANGLKRIDTENSLSFK